MNENCGCCEGVQKLTPHDIANRPGLDALVYRIGTQASFLETMIARLSSLSLDVPLNIFNVEGQEEIATIQPLQKLTTRAVSDPAIAFLDAWATVADVLTFYQERIANEGYLRTAIERRSILELARLVGYTLRPGVSASVYLAYTLEKDHNVVIAPGNRAQSVPGPGEKAQSFETAEKLEARFVWNALKPRQTRPQLITGNVLSGNNPLQPANPDIVIYFQGTATNVKRGDPLLFLFPVLDNQGNVTKSTVGQTSKVRDVEKQQVANRTKVILDPTDVQQLSGAAMALQGTVSAQISSVSTTSGLRDIVDRLEVPPSLQPPNTQRLVREVTQTFAAQSDIHPQILVNITPVLQNTLYNAVVNAPVTPATPTDQTVNATSVQVFRVQAAPFGFNAPLFAQVDENKVLTLREWYLAPRISVELSSEETSSTLPTFDGRVPFSYSLRIIQEDGTDEHTLRNLVDVGGVSNKTIVVGNTQRVLVNITLDGDPPRFQKGSFEFLDLNHIITVTLGQDKAWTVKIDNNPFSVTPNQPPSPPQSIDAGRAEISFDRTLSVGLFIMPENVLPLDAQYEKIVPQSWVSIERLNKKPVISQVLSVQIVYKTDYGINARVTQLVLDRPWLQLTDSSLADIRGIVVHAQSEPRDLAEAPIEEDIAPDAPPASPGRAQGHAPMGRALAAAAATPTSADTTNKGTDTIELDQLYDGLKAGQRLIVFGERTDVPGIDGNPIRGILDGELVMLKAVKQDVFRLPDNTPLSGDKPHTFLTLANNLRSTYRRDTLVIYANVVRATHGETRNETLGSGDGSQELQTFILSQSPLTYVSANTTSGIASTLEVRVNDLLWHEAGSLPELHATDRGYITETDDADKTTVIFGNGVFGARLPTGVENVKAKYRTGIGQPGNVPAGRITLLSTKPLGVKAVVNPLEASGGADRENATQARRNVPLAALALDRLVSVEDYEHFARTFGGIGKASAVPISDGHRQLVHLTIVGADNAPILTTSDLYRNLFSALRQFGDPNEPLIVVVAEVLFIVISARVHLLPDFKFESVENKIRKKLLDIFSFDRRDLGQSVFQSEVIGVIQSVAGVDYVELEIMGAVGQTAIVNAIDSGQSDSSEEDDKDKEDKKEEEGESPEVEQAEEFIEQLGLKSHQDVIVALARPDKNNPLATSGIAPAQLAFLSPDVPDTLILTELP